MGRRFLIVGIVLLFLGIQLRMVDSYVLTQKATQFIQERAHKSGFRTANPYNYQSTLMAAGPIAKKTIKHPRWTGWALVSVGAVLALHGLTLKDE